MNSLDIMIAIQKAKESGFTYFARALEELLRKRIEGKQI
jgi:hypothetical protein